MLRQDIMEAMKTALRAKDERTLGTTRMIIAKMKDLDIAARPSGNMDGISEAEIMTMLQGMAKQRRESIEMYKQGHREDLVQQESEEIEVIERFLPKQMSEDEIKSAVQALITSTGAAGVKDMGKIMGALKKDYAGKLDFSKAGGIVKGLLGAA